MRGTRTHRHDQRQRQGIIPAYAGNTMEPICRAVYSGDHPRVCGEHSNPAKDGVWGTGSSPRMRGTRDRRSDRRVQPGIIPAYAGNTSNTKSKVRPPRDHPRVCGEHLPARRNIPVRMGSSPRMRGTPRVAPCAGAVMGIIPAYAGNTSDILGGMFNHSDHPRVCGEHTQSPLPQAAFPGSSPRMRGTLDQRHHRNGRLGIIPAYAGNTSVPSGTIIPSRDHPRVCGEHRQRRR